MTSRKRLINAESRPIRLYLLQSAHYRLHQPACTYSKSGAESTKRSFISCNSKPAIYSRCHASVCLASASAFYWCATVITYNGSPSLSLQRLAYSMQLLVQCRNSRQSALESTSFMTSHAMSYVAGSSGPSTILLLHPPLIPRHPVSDSLFRHFTGTKWMLIYFSMRDERMLEPT